MEVNINQPKIHSTQKANLSRLSSEVNIKKGARPLFYVSSMNSVKFFNVTFAFIVATMSIPSFLSIKHLAPFNYLWERKDLTDVSGRLDFVLFSWRGKGLYPQP